MSRKKKNGNEDRTTKYIILVTVIIQLITALVTLIGKLFE